MAGVYFKRCFFKIRLTEYIPLGFRFHVLSCVCAVKRFFCAIITLCVVKIMTFLVVSYNYDDFTHTFISVFFLFYNSYRVVLWSEIFLIYLHYFKKNETAAHELN